MAKLSTLTRERPALDFTTLNLVGGDLGVESHEDRSPTRAKVAEPTKVPRFLDCVRLDAMLESSPQMRMILLMAPAGFGKTTALAALARHCRQRGTVAARVSIDAHDTPALLARCIVFAFREAGLDLALTESPDPWAAMSPGDLSARVAEALERSRRPCLLVLDDVEHAPPGATVAFLDALVNHGPSNLRVALGCRSNPGIDLASHSLSGTGLMLDAEHLRFSPANVAEYFDGKLSRSELSGVVERTGGWPAAVAAEHTRWVRRRSGAGADTNTAQADFLVMRLMGSLTERQRVALTELSVFDRIDAGLVDGVLGSAESRRLLLTTPALAGLVVPEEDGSHRGSHRLNPVLRRYCATRLFQLDPERDRALRERLARALAVRGEHVRAWEQAVRAGNHPLLAELIEAAGATQLWLGDGLSTVLAAAALVTPDLAQSYPRLALLRCVAMRRELRVREANEELERIRRVTEDFTRDREGGDDEALALDSILARSITEGGACLTVYASLAPVQPPSADDDWRHSSTWEFLTCCASLERADFAGCQMHGEYALARFPREARYGCTHAALNMGMAEMAQGRFEEARGCYARARKLAVTGSTEDEALVHAADMLMLELDLESNRTKAVEQRLRHARPELRAVSINVYAAMVAVNAELARRRQGAEGELDYLRGTLGEARAAGLKITFLHFVEGAWISALLESGRVEQAAREWTLAGPPATMEEMFDNDVWPWRTIESLGCARIRLLAAQGDFAAAEAHAAEGLRLAESRGLLRLAVRIGALSMEIAESSADPDAAEQALLSTLERMGGTGYHGPLARPREVTLAVAGRLQAQRLEGSTRAALNALLANLGAAPEQPKAPPLSSRETAVLEELARGGVRNKEIARHLDISEAGVRFHLKNIYRKLGVKGRDAAVRQFEAVREFMENGREHHAEA